MKDIQEIKKDYFSLYYEKCFHDCTLKALERLYGDLHSIGPLFQFLSDRRTLRKIVTNCCIDLTCIQNPYHCKRQDFDVMVEKLNGTLLIACSARYDEMIGGYGQSFEENMSEASASGARLITYKVAKMVLGNQICAIRFEVNAVNERGELVELKSIKYHNFNRLENKDFFLHIWIQMVLSNTPFVKIGIPWRMCRGWRGYITAMRKLNYFKT